SVASFPSSAPPPPLHSCPTRRSSDLEGELFGAERPSPPGRHGGRAPDGVAGDLARLPQADEQDSLRLGAGRVEQRRLVALSLEVAARNDAPHDTARRAVQIGEGRGKHAPLPERSEERRVGKEGRWEWSAEPSENNDTVARISA